jgi:glycosyltransferase involved in cell wall biosynthesis
MKKKAKICLNTMVANESHVILRMLESCWKYIDYWIIQDNGSKDGTQQLITNFFAEKEIEGFLYETNWQYPGINRDDALQKCLVANHGCDWILRIDADESIQVSDDFDWSLLEDNSIQSFNIMASQGNCIYHRCWLWNAKLPWKFKHDKRHEIIYLDGFGEGFQRYPMPDGFRHVVFGDGKSWFNPTKFYGDALEIEKDLLTSGKMKSDFYHLFYIAKSYRDAVLSTDSNWPFGVIHRDECTRRAIFFFERYLDTAHDYGKNKDPKYIDEMGYISLISISECYRLMGQHEKSLNCLSEAEKFCPERNEHLLEMAHVFLDIGENLDALRVLIRASSPERKNPFPNYTLFLNNDAYCDTGDYIHHLCQEIHQIIVEKSLIIQQ